MSAKPRKENMATGWLFMATLAGITGTVSYLDGVWVVSDVGWKPPIAYLLPFVPDLMIAAALLAMLHAAKTGNGWPWQSMISLSIGVVATIIMNVTAGLHHGPGGALLSGLMPVAFILAFEQLLVMYRNAQRVSLTAEPAQCGHKVAVTRDEAILAAVTVMSQRAAATAFGVSHGYVGNLVSAQRKASMNGSADA